MSQDSQVKFEILQDQLIRHLQIIYPTADHQNLADKLIKAMNIKQPDNITPHQGHWTQADIAVITYGDTLKQNGQAPLKVLKQWLDEQLRYSISIVHILPFFPFSSDDGFSVIDYLSVNETHGEWKDIEAIAKDYKLMADVVINHCSARSRWFENFKKGRAPGHNYFVTADPSEDLSKVVRPRTSPLLAEINTDKGTENVWCTFSHDQVDLNFANPEVLLEFAAIIRFYLDRGIRWFRLDAVAFLWKRVGTSCIHLEETHEIIKLLRTLCQAKCHDAVLISETNVPNIENLSYFGNANEAHLIYNFSLPPLLVHTLTTGDCRHLKTWLMSMPPPQPGTAYLNFIASHDGIGLRPTEGLLSEGEINNLLATMQQFGGRITWRRLDNQSNKPYEINISLYDALQGTQHSGPDRWQQQRFLCAHTIMLALEGVPAFYIHSLLATANDYHRMEHTGHNRSINRSQWQIDELCKVLEDDGSHHRHIFNSLKTLITTRKQQPAFHPNATQFTLQLGNEVFGFWRQSLDRQQSIFALNNISEHSQEIRLSDINLISTDTWWDLIGNKMVDPEQPSLVLAPYQCVWLSNRSQ